ncbi:trigger factor [Candidatus Kinetoplastidibacterium crithidiae]|uniref:Trigger factor n=1 Tax=Candidatus Kinetoplastidibacterium crithidiae TCC036E TaxID=1208918 RepID=M1LTU7_9PROT|nr:trigger factor [Candidatus Kinetoplastibacterium crithidii]AFZ82816.1 trigger factor [Candidatus Kinetoplastibacterium crithidii (ex Angomonas deanei ATCC 30255)]AGF47531.1 trigger factor [Candidatus Kinetoplastibacterium crithidii TCC036E]
MQPIIESLSSLKRRAVLKISNSCIEDELEKELLSLSRNTKISGFRPGKAPISVVKRTYGHNVRQDVVTKLLSNSFDQLVKENNLFVVGYPNIIPVDSINNSDELCFAAEFEIYPEISIPSFESLDIKRYRHNLTEEDVKKTLAILQKQRSVFEKKDDHCAEIGDKIILSYNATIDGVSFEGGSSESLSVIVGNNQLLPDFENSLIGMREGDSKELDLKFPDTYHDSKVAGKEAKFSITVKEVFVGTLPDLDDNFAKLFSNEDNFNLEKLEENVKSSIEREIGIRLKNLNKDSVMGVLLKNIEFEIPEVLIRNEMQLRLNSLKSRLKDGNIKDLESLSKDILLEEESKKMVKLGLIMSEIAKNNDIKVDDEQILSYLNNFAKNYEDPEKFVSHYMADSNKKSEVAALILENNIVDHILSRANISEEELTFENLMGLE